MLCIILASFLALVSAAAPALAEQRKLDFNRDIRPILSENCFQCHGFDEKARQAELRLDVAESALADREGVPAIVPSHPEQSELLRRISLPHDDEEFMPAEGKTPLTDRQVDIIRWWIQVGAPNGGTIGELEAPEDMRQKLSDELGVSF